MHILNDRQEYGSIQNTMELLKTCIKGQRMICWETLCIHTHTHTHTNISRQGLLVQQ